MISFVDCKSSGALEVKMKARETEAAAKAQKAAGLATTGTFDGTFDGTLPPAGSGSPGDIGVDVGSPTVPSDALGTDLANAKPTDAPSTTSRTTKTPMHLRPVFSSMPRAGRVIVRATKAPAWGKGKHITGVAFVKSKSEHGEIFEATFPKLLPTTVRTKEFKPWIPPRPGSPSYKGRMEKIGFNISETTGSTTFLETKKSKPRRYRRSEGYRYAKEAIQDTREEAKNRGLSLWKPDEKRYIANILQHNDKAFYELVDKYQSPGSFELVLQKVRLYHLPFEITSTEYVLMSDMIAEIEACKATNKWVEQTRINYEQRIRKEEEDERRSQKEAEQRARWKEEARAKKEAADREKALKTRGRKINPTNNFMEDLVKYSKIAEEGRAETRAGKLRAANLSSSEASKGQTKTVFNPLIETIAAKDGKNELVKKEAVESAKKLSESSTAVKTPTKRKAEEFELIKQETVPKAKRSLKSSSPRKAGRGVSSSASSPKKASSASAITEKIFEPPQKKACTQEPVQDNDSLMTDAKVLQDGHIHIPPGTSEDDELLIIAGADINEFAQAPAEVQQKLPVRRKLTAKKPRAKKAPKVEEETQWAESDDEATDSEDERWEQSFRKKAAEYKAWCTNRGEDDLYVEVGIARVLRKRKSPLDSDDNSGTDKVDDLSDFIVNTPDYIPVRQPKKAKTSDSAKDYAPRKADFSKYVAGL